MALQEIWRSSQFDWDDPLPDKIGKFWTHLFADKERLKYVEFLRCLKPSAVNGPSQLPYSPTQVLVLMEQWRICCGPPQAFLKSDLSQLK